jgi:hypothetical protein
MTVAVRRLFTHKWSVLWATTYTCGVTAFDEYFLGQLRPDDLNVTILADLGKLTEAWSAIEETAGLTRLRRVNRAYLLRPVAWHGHAFHAKTYLFGNEQGAVLLIGSGNADLRGLGAGYEVFAQFRSDEPAGAAAIAAWSHWMSGLVPLLADPLVEARWADARNRLPWLRDLPSSVGSPLVQNLDTPLLDRFTAGVDAPVDELHVAAPYWDDHLRALAALVERVRPRQLHIYLGAGAKLNGKRLLAFIADRHLDATIWTFTEPHFVHAKLIAAISGSTAHVLSGSANLSHVALLAAAADGNVEAGVLASHDADSARALFTPPGLVLRRLEAEELASLTPDLPPEDTGPPLRLLRCERLVDGHLSLAIAPMPTTPVLLFGLPADEPAVGLTLARSEGTALYNDLARARTVDPWESTAPLVRLVDERGVALSNPVPVDDPEALAATLRGRDDADRGALRDLDWDELDSPVGRILEELQASCFFEPRRARRKRTFVVTKEQGAESDTSFWQRYGELNLEAVPLGQHSRSGRRHLPTDPIFAQLHALLIRAPYLPELKPIRPSAIPDDELDDPDAARRRWAMETRQRVRIFNVLRRWCRAVRDPELLALDPLLTTHNYRALLGALIKLWLGDEEGGRYFDEQHLHQLLAILVESLVGDRGTHKGALVVADAEARERMVGDLREHGAPAVLAQLLFDVIRPERRDRVAVVVEWQPTVRAALEIGVVEADNGPIGDVLRWAADYVDEDGWRRQVQERYRVDARFSNESLAKGYGYELVVVGLTGLFADPRAVSVVQEALRFRPAAGILVVAHGEKDRISIRDGEHAYARVAGSIESSPEPISLAQIMQLPAGSVLGSLIRPISEDKPITA